MLNVLLLILKIILWILLGVIGLVLLIVLLVLFAPILYKANVSYHESADVSAKVNFLCVSFSLKFNQAKKELVTKLRIFGIPLGGKKSDETPEKKQDRKKQDKKKQDKKKQNKQEEQTLESVSEEIASQEEITQEEITQEETIQEEALPEDAKVSFLKRFYLKLTKLWELIQDNTPDKLIERFETKKTKLEKKLKRYEKFWNLPCTVKTRNYLPKYLKKTMLHILPRSMKGHVHYGFKEAYQTGMYTGYISMLPLAYQRGLSFEPDFHNQIIECDLRIKGRIFIGYILRIALKLYIWRTIKVAKKVFATKPENR